MNNQAAIQPRPSQQRYWVQDKTRLCRVTMGAEYADEAARDGFREVTLDEQESFREATHAAKENGWKPGSRKPFESFLTANQ
ncbi:TPA: hypothetical protein NI618_001696 [Pseudomonas aeruginosa]|nr:hypothetical protein [Pseudomonas aeruginosa]MCV4061348.1 hypothetical protein [Pseudomonas aeruginosa]MCV4077167.1 hypothetical protein [Pseudomonas aeruginosa]MCV4148762.1 hypothetical protein [Pseudomonas aeruginosa]MCV4180435.1 hypothetical protein [Pseudomonas aeruginosa]MCV4219898.1 hypothetical protein [Pseudomonas aeruginosa]